ncbi:MAG: bifunctional ADP-heptose synthase [Bacteroidales bacterium]
MNCSEIFNVQASENVLIVGDVMLDSYIWGNVERISPEAPVPVVHAIETEHRLGGAANVAKNIAALGLNPLLCSVIGDDDSGKKLCSVLESRHISSEFCVVSPRRVTTTKTRIMSGNHQMLRVDTEEVDVLSDEENNQVCSHVLTLLQSQSIAAVILQDYDKGVLSPANISFIIAEAEKKNIPVVVDPKKNNFTQYSHIDLFKPNFKEFCDGVGVECDKADVERLFELAQSYMNEHAVKRVMITLSEQGVFIANGHEYIHIPTQVRHVADVSGAGDTVISVAVVCLIAGLPDAEVARISNIAAGLACEMPGVVSITKEQLLKVV